MASPSPGLRIGKYLLIEGIGTGGFGAVWRARDEQLSRDVALKFLHSDHPEDLVRFAREARMSAQLAHPNIVPVHEVGDHEGRPYLAMDFIDGKPANLARLEPRRAAEVVRDAARAIQHAHEHGVVHRDLKPQNLLVGRDGRAWVTDFGLARRVGGGGTLTAAGMMIGTPAYMAPEQAEGRRCDERTDVYGLGATLYELLSGRPPFEGESALDIAMAVIGVEPKKPGTFRPVPTDLELITLKAMEKDAARRYSGARDVADDLQRWLDGEPILAKAPSLMTRGAKWARHNRATAAAGGALAAATIIVAGLLLLRSSTAAAEREALRRQAVAAEQASDWSTAARLWASLEPMGALEARGRSEEASRKAREEGARRRAEELARDAGELEAEYERMRRRLDELDGDLRRRWMAVRPADSIAVKEPLFAMEREQRLLQQKLAVLERQVVGPYASALRLTGDRAIAERFAAFLWARLDEAVRDEDEARAAAFEQMLKQTNLPSVTEALEHAGQITIEADAQAWLFRYEEDRQTVLRARPYRAATRECQAEGNFDATDFNRLAGTVSLRRGSYLVLLRRGSVEWRVPVLVSRGIENATVKAARPEDLPEGFVWVAGGRFISGGDREATGSLALDRATVLEDFAVKRFEVTIREYVEFLRALVASGSAEEAQKRSPRQHLDGGYFLSIPRDATTVDVAAGIDQSCPVFGVSYVDALAYAQWLTSAARGPWTFRLPTGLEWEKAARGADGRKFPWGNRFDASFCVNRHSSASSQPVGARLPDESPWGVRDLGGSVREWCADLRGGSSVDVLLKGGAYTLDWTWQFRAATNWYDYGVTTYVGFRVAATREK